MICPIKAIYKYNTFYREPKRGNKKGRLEDSIYSRDFCGTNYFSWSSRLYLYLILRFRNFKGVSVSDTEEERSRDL